MDNVLLIGYHVFRRSPDFGGAGNPIGLVIYYMLVEYALNKRAPI